MGRTGRRVTVAAPIGPGAFLTNGNRLVEVRELTPEHIVVEEGDVEAPDVDYIGHDEVARDWRVVERTPDAEA